MLIEGTMATFLIHTKTQQRSDRNNQIINLTQIKFLTNIEEQFFLSDLRNGTGQILLGNLGSLPGRV